jgi:hypothetical protein
MAYISGSLVLMADLSWKDNSTICKGDVILGADLMPAVVVETNTNILANRRIMSFLENPQFRFTENNPVWARDDILQWWWAENVSRLQLEWKNNGSGLKIIDSPLVSYDVEFATLNGFEKYTVIDVTEKYNYNFNTMMPFFRIDRCCPIIVNGHIVAGGIINEYAYDYTKFNWIDSYNSLFKSGDLTLIKNGLL